VCGYIVEENNGEVLESCWGYYGSEYALQEAKSIVDNMVKEDAKFIFDNMVKEHGERTRRKNMVKN